MSYTAEELLDAIVSEMSKRQGEDVDQYGWFWGELDYASPVVLDGIGALAVVSEDGGGEGGSENVELILKITSEDAGVRYFKKYGAYYSHDGYYWEGAFNEVFQKEKTITVYEEV